MMSPAHDCIDERVLVIAPTGRDAPLTCQFLSEAGLSAEACGSMEELCRKLSAGAGVVFFTEEALTPDTIEQMAATLREQPPWSDLPLIILTSGGGATPSKLAKLKTLDEIGNVTLIERPVRVITLVSAIQAALRARRRQYEARDYLAQQKRAQEERSRLLEEAERANRAKDEFLSTLSHELRTPMTAILGWAHLLRASTLNGEHAARALETIERNAQAQTKLIDDMLDISRIITGKLRVDVRPVDLASVVEAAVDTARPAAEAKDIRLQMLLDPQAGPASGDPDRLQQVIWNLLSNAIKFTPRGGRVQVRLERSDSHVEITVSDTGQGIAPEFLPQVFDRFRQADPSTTRTHGGLGLGLAIVRQLTELHGGTVRADSPGEGQGATFTVTLPVRAVHRRDGLRAGDADRVPSTAAGGVLFECSPALDGLRVLVVDDDEDARIFIRSVLEQCRAKVTAVTSSSEALDTLERLRPDVLISDIGMPEEDGYALIRKVRARPAEHGGRIPAAALTAYAREEDRVRALVEGYQIHVPKPVSPLELVAVVASLAGRVGNV